MRLVFLTALVTFVVDQLTKYLVVVHMNLRELGEIDVLAPYLNLRMTWNYGINFGLVASNSDVTRWALITVAIAISVFVLLWVWRSPPGKWGFVAAGLLIGGALGNVVDRIVYGAVADFLNMSCCGFENPYAFNVADIMIFAGAIGLALLTDGKKPS